MRFSIIIPVFNAEKRILNALEMIDAQTFKDYELITVCDACVDKSIEICKQYTDKVYDVNFNNDGLTRSFGIDRAAGDYILFLDDDDWWVNFFVLEEINNHLLFFGEVDILQFAFYWSGRGAMPAKKPDGTFWPNVWSKAWKRAAIGSTRFPCVYSVSDLHFTNAMLQKNPSIDFLERIMVFYNWMRPGSISEQQSRKQ